MDVPLKLNLSDNNERQKCSQIRALLPRPSILKFIQRGVKSNQAQQSMKSLNKYPPFETIGRSAIIVKLMGRILANIKAHRAI